MKVAFWLWGINDEKQNEENDDVGEQGDLDEDDDVDNDDKKIYQGDDGKFHEKQYASHT